MGASAHGKGHGVRCTILTIGDTPAFYRLLVQLHRLVVLLQVLESGGEIDECVDCRLMVLAVDLLVGIVHFLEHLSRLVEAPVQLEEHGLIVDDRAVRRMHTRKVLLNIEFVVVEDLLGEAELAQRHGLGETSNRILHSLVVFRWYVRVGCAWIKLYRRSFFLFLINLRVQWLEVAEVSHLVKLGKRLRWQARRWSSGR